MLVRHRSSQIYINVSWGVPVNINSENKVREWFVSTADNLPDVDIVEAGVRHSIFGSGPNSSELTGGKIKMNTAYSKPRNLFPLYRISMLILFH